MENDETERRDEMELDVLTLRVLNVVVDVVGRG